jgi:glycosyltransferase involved in cell wall biosynthesis
LSISIGAQVKKVLIVAMADSVHTGRWISQFDGEAINFMLFPSTPHRRVHSLIKQRLNQEIETKVRISKWMSWAALPLGIADLVFANFFRAKFLSHEIDKFQPDVIHIMETQHAGYLTDRALTAVKSKPRVILSIWGSDLFWFQKFAKDREKMSRLFPKVNILITECERDEALATEFGFIGECLYGIPASGGVDRRLLKDLSLQILPSKRKTIAIKGYSGFVGLGLQAVRSLVPLVNELRSYEIVIYSCSFQTARIAKRIRKQSGLNIQINLKHSMTTKQMEDLFLSARVVVGASLSDGLPATVKEAICNGAFPVQTNTSCAGEWLKDEVSVLLVPPNDMSALSAAILRALTDDHLVDNAAEVNQKIARDQMDLSLIQDKLVKVYS